MHFLQTRATPYFFLEKEAVLILVNYIKVIQLDKKKSIDFYTAKVYTSRKKENKRT